MGIDIRHKHLKRHKRETAVSKDPYIALLIKLYRYLARRTGANFNKIILKRLFLARRHRPPLSISRIAR